MIVPALILVAAILAALLCYISHWLRRMYPGIRRWIAVVVSVVLTVASVNLFHTSGIVLLHFWFLSMFWEGLLKLLRRKPGKLLLTLVPAVVTAGLMTWGMWNLAHPVQTVYRYESEKPIRPEGYRAVLITDTHYDTIQSPAVLEAKVAEINALHPDFVVLGGDIVEEGTSKARMQEVFSTLGQLETTFGTYYVYGNHDRQAYSGSPKYTVAELNAAIEGNGITILKSDYVTLNDEIILAGMEDPSWHRDDPRIPAAQVLDGADTNKLVIIADHQPNDWKANSAAGMDLQLSGHTHAGQVWPAGLFLELVGGLNYGRYDRDDCTAIVSSGFAGWGFTVRTSERSEYVVVDIESGHRNDSLYVSVQ